MNKKRNVGGKGEEILEGGDKELKCEEELMRKREQDRRWEV